MVQNSVTRKISIWITPGLILIIGYFLKMKLDSIDSQLKDIIELRINYASLKTQVDGVEYRLGQLENSKGSKVSRMTYEAKLEDEFDIKKHIKTN